MKNTLKIFLVAAATFFAGHIFGQNTSSNITIQGNSASAVQQVNTQNTNDIYPNPNNGEFNVNVASLSEKAFVTIYNTLGQLIIKEKISGPNHLVNMKSSVAGTYHLIVFDNNQPVYKTKFIKS